MSARCTVPSCSSPNSHLAAHDVGAAVGTCVKGVGWRECHEIRHRPHMQCRYSSMVCMCSNHTWKKDTRPQHPRDVRREATVDRFSNCNIRAFSHNLVRSNLAMPLFCMITLAEVQKSLGSVRPSMSIMQKKFRENRTLRFGAPRGIESPAVGCYERWKVESKKKCCVGQQYLQMLESRRARRSTNAVARLRHARSLCVLQDQQRNRGYIVTSRMEVPVCTRSIHINYTTSLRLLVLHCCLDAS